jgi:hypothetical protein
MIAVLSNPTLEVLRRLFVGAVQVATLHPACHQGSIRIFDNFVGKTARLDRIDSKHCLVSFD